MTPEEAIETGIFNRLTHATNGITVEAGKYCADQGGVQKYQGDVDLTKESMIEWARAGVSEGPIVLIVVGEEVDYDTDYRETAVGDYSVQLYFASANLRTTHEALEGDAGSETRKPGIWQVKSDILDRLLNFGIVQDANGTWFDPVWVVRGRKIAKEPHLVLYELIMMARVAVIHGLVPFSSLDDLEGVDVTLQKEPDAGTGEEFQVGIKVDVP
jgi:hypothetical protein